MLIIIGICNTSCLDEDQQAPIPLLSFKVSGRLLLSCSNPVPLSNIQVTVGATKLYTDSLGNFEGTAFNYGTYTNVYIHGKKDFNYIYLRTGIPVQDVKLGNLYASNPPQIPLVVFYNLKNLKLSDFKPITIQYSKLGSNQDKIANKPEDLLMPDTVLISSANFRFVGPNSNSLAGTFITAKIENGTTHTHILNFTDFCGQKVTTIEFPR